MSNTNENLQAAFAGESQANRRYLFFAEKADEAGHKQIARLFRAAAEAETVHARNHLGVMGGIKSAKENLEAAIKEAKEALTGEDVARINEASDKLTQASHKLADLMYKQQAESSGAPTEEPQGDAPETAEANDDTAEESSQDNNDDVIDAEFTEK